MSDLVLYLGITIVGYFLGSRIRNQKERFGWTGKVQTAALMVMVLLMGTRMGANEEVIENISTIGLSAFLMTVLMMGFSVLGIFLVRQFFRIDRYGRLKEKTNHQKEGEIAETEEAPTVETVKEETEKTAPNMMTVIIVIAVMLGMAVGYFAIRPMFAGRMDVFDQAAGLGIKIGLCLLLLFVGLDLGIEGTVVENFRRVGLRIFAFPAAVVVGTLLGAALCAIFVDLSLRECLAIGAGFGWYTLAPGIIMEHGYVTASAVSFLHNVMRELFSIILIPIVAKKIGYIETTGMPGAAAMDVCLPIVEKATRSDIAVYSFVSGVILSILVPVLVPLIIGG